MATPNPQLLHLNHPPLSQQPLLYQLQQQQQQQQQQQLQQQHLNGRGGPPMPGMTKERFQALLQVRAPGRIFATMLCTHLHTFLSASKHTQGQRRNAREQRRARQDIQVSPGIPAAAKYALHSLHSNIPILISN